MAPDRDQEVFQIGKVVESEDGATAIEYALIAALIAVVIIAVVTTLGQNVSGTFNSVSDTMLPPE